MEIIPGVVISISMIVGWMVKISIFLLTILALIMIRQESLMDRVVTLPVGKGLKIFTWGYFLMVLFMMVVVLLA